MNFIIQVKVIADPAMKYNIKPITTRLADEILSNLQERSAGVYRGLTRLLDDWDKNEQDKLTYERLQDLLKNQHKLVDSLNVYLQEDIQLKVEKNLQQLFEQFLKELSTTNKKAFAKAFDKINQLKNQGVDEEYMIMEELIQTFKDEPEVQRRLQQIFVKPSDKDSTKNAPPSKKKKEKPPANIYDSYYQQRRKYDYLYDQDKTKHPTSTSHTNPNEQIFFIQNLESILSQKDYDSLIKLINLYQLGILSKIQIINLLPQKLLESTQSYQNLKDSIECRQSERRRQSNVFKPLTELNYSQSQRTTHSYVKMPSLYPTRCKGKQTNPLLNQLLNIKWVIVPIGSQHTSFSIRLKNPFEEILLKSEDQRYQFDLTLYRCKKCAQLIDKILKIDPDNQSQAETKLNQVLNMGIIQNIYKNASKEQKEQIEVNLKANPSEMLAIILQRVRFFIKDLEHIRASVAIKSWHQNSQKNYYKSLDRRCFEFKKHERQLTKITAFVEQLENLSPLTKPTILNTYEGLSRTEFVHQVNNINSQIDFEDTNKDNPNIIMYFENIYIKQISMQMIEAFVQAQTQYFDKQVVRKFFFEDFFAKYLNISCEDVDTADFYMTDYEKKREQIKSHLPIKKEIVKDQIINYKLEMPPLKTRSNKQQPVKREYDDEQNFRIKVLLKESDVGFLPKYDKTKRYSLMYGSQSLYCLFRLYYIIYERVLRAYQLCYTFQQTDRQPNKQKVGAIRFQMFLHIYFSSLKNKENSKFQEFLKELFGQSSYLFFSLIKLYEGLVKSAQACVYQSFTIQLLRLFENDKIECEQIYMQLVNKICLTTANSGRIFRFTFKNQLLYINYFNSIYKGWFVQKKQKETFNFEKTANKIQNYLLGKKGQHHHAEQLKKKNQTLLIKNNMEYTCIPKSIKLISKGDDLMIRRRRQITNTKKTHLMELKRVFKAFQNQRRWNHFD